MCIALQNEKKKKNIDYWKQVEILRICYKNEILIRVI